MTTEKKPCRPLCRRQKYFWVPIGVNFRQQLLQRATNTTTLQRVRARTAVWKMEMKRVKKFNEKKRVELTEMASRLPQLMAEGMHVLEEKKHALEERKHALEGLVWTQACCDTVEALLFAP